MNSIESIVGMHRADANKWLERNITCAYNLGSVEQDTKCTDKEKCVINDVISRVKLCLIVSSCSSDSVWFILTVLVVGTKRDSHMLMVSVLGKL